MEHLYDLNNLNRLISQNLRKLRKNRRLTLDELSSLSGVSKSMLGQIERGESSPSVSTLWKVSFGLKVSFSALLEPSEQPAEFIENHKAPLIPNEKEGVSLYSIFPFEPGRNFEIIYAELQAGACSSHQAQHSNAEQFILVQEGCLTVHIGQSTYTVPKGCSLHFGANQPHDFENTTETLVSFCKVLYYS